MRKNNTFHSFLEGKYVSKTGFDKKISTLNHGDFVLKDEGHSNFLDGRISFDIIISLSTLMLRRNFLTVYS